ncbi:hypothetical protein ACP4OV_030837 [Aristida adscensionis]
MFSLTLLSDSEGGDGAGRRRGLASAAAGDAVKGTPGGARPSTATAQGPATVQQGQERHGTGQGADFDTRQGVSGSATTARSADLGEQRRTARFGAQFGWIEQRNGVLWVGDLNSGGQQHRRRPAVDGARWERRRAVTSTGGAGKKWPVKNIDPT